MSLTVATAAAAAEFKTHYSQVEPPLFAQAESQDNTHSEHTHTYKFRVTESG